MKLPPLPNVSDLIKLYGLSANQKLSQNFLLNLKITDKIVKYAGDLKNSTVIEVGPGPGSLTRSILNSGARKVIVIEKDRRFLPALEVLQQAAPKGIFHIVHGDMLIIDEEQLLSELLSVEERNNIKLIGNLPFNVGTQLLLKWLHLIPLKKGLFHFGKASMILLFQSEVADRIVATIGNKYFGRLSVMVQRLCKVKKLFTIPGKQFVPPPKVNSTAIYLEPLDKIVGSPLLSTKVLEYTCKELFSQRRKMISNCIKNLGKESENLLQITGIEPNLRPQNLTIEQWCLLAYEFQKKLMEENPEKMKKLELSLDENFLD